jgi:hypothetical protein
MSVLKFLATGKSLVGMKDRSTPYRMRAANLLPKFESDKNPFASTTLADGTLVPAESPAAEPMTAQPVIAPAKPAIMETLSLFDNTHSPTPATPAREKKVATVHPVMAFAPKAPAPASATVPPATPAAAPAEYVLVNRPVAVAKPKAAQPAPQPVAPAPVAASVAHTNVPALAATPGKSFSFVNMFKKLNPLAFIKAKRTERNAVRSRSLRPPVQAELSLEKIKVMRNDLSDADLEVVPARQPMMPAMTTMQSTAPATPAPAPAKPGPLNRLTSRIFHASQTNVP